MEKLFFSTVRPWKISKIYLKHEYFFSRPYQTEEFVYVCNQVGRGRLTRIISQMGSNNF